jgi:hypothetical protein
MAMFRTIRCSFATTEGFVRSKLADVNCKSAEETTNLAASATARQARNRKTDNL